VSQHFAELVALEVGRASGASEAYRRAARVLYDELGLALAASWEPRGPESDAPLMVTSLCHRGGEAMAAFVEQTHNLELPVGEGLPGRVFETCEAQWIEDVTEEKSFDRRETAAAANLRTAIGFPALVEGRVIAAIEGYATDVRPRDQALLDTLEELGRVMGAVADRFSDAEEGEPCESPSGSPAASSASTS
jgi:hypothetical protein